MAMNDEKLKSQTLNVWKDFFDHLSGKHLAQHFAQIVQSTSDFEHFEKKMFLLAYLFWKLPTVKRTVTQMFK